MLRFLAVTSLPLAWLIYADATGPVDGWMELLREFGLPAVLVIFFVWTGHLDKQRMGGRITELEKYIEDVVTKDVGSHEALIRSIDRFSNALASHSETADRIEKMMLTAMEVMRPVPEDRRKQLDLLGEIRNLLKGRTE